MMLLRTTIGAPGGTNQDTIATGVDYGSHVMKECELEIGGQKIDKHYEDRWRQFMLN